MFSLQLLGGVPMWKLNPWGGWKLNKIRKLWRARSRLYRRRFWHPNTHFSAFCEIYKIRIPLHRSKFKILQFFDNLFLTFWTNFDHFSSRASLILARKKFNFPYCKCLIPKSWQAWVFNDQPCECADVGHSGTIGRAAKMGWKKKWYRSCARARDTVPVDTIRFYLHKEFRAAGIRFSLHKEFGAAGIRFYLHKRYILKTCSRCAGFKGKKFV